MVKHFESIDALRKYAETRRCGVEVYEDTLMFSPITTASGPNIACLFGWDDTGAMLEGVYIFDIDGELHVFPWSAIPDFIVKDFEQQYAEDCAERAAAAQEARADAELEWQREQARYLMEVVL
jgi:hypothetical protein